MNQKITIDGEAYEVDVTVAGALDESLAELESLRNALRRLASFPGGEPCWCQCEGGKHSRPCRDARQLRIWPRRENGETIIGLPPIRHPAGEKYAAIYRKLDAQITGEWLPVSFDTKREAFNFRLACVKHRTRRIEAKQRAKTVYARNTVASAQENPHA